MDACDAPNQKFRSTPFRQGRYLMLVSLALLVAASQPAAADLPDASPSPGPVVLEGNPEQDIPPAPVESPAIGAACNDEVCMAINPEPCAGILTAGARFKLNQYGGIYIQVGWGVGGYGGYHEDCN